MKKIVKKAFTMIEMMVVVAIIGVLSSVLLPNVTKMLDKSKKASSASVVNTTLTSLMQYYDDNGDYPVLWARNASNLLRPALRDYASYNNYGTFLQDTWKRWMSYHPATCWGTIGAIYSNGPNGTNSSWSCLVWRDTGFNSDDIGRVLKK